MFVVYVLLLNIIYCVGDHIISFVGDILRTPEEVNARSAAGHGGYTLGTATGTGWFLDCFKTARLGQCFASISNTPYRCRNVVTGSNNPSSNARLAVSFPTAGKPPTWSLKCASNIDMGHEILWSYGADYVFPEHYTLE